MVPSKVNRIEALIKPITDDLQLDLWGVQFFSHNKKFLLRVYIDKLGGINLNDCEKVSRQISAVLDVEDSISGQYTLEVSSPGIDRPLFTFSQYEKNIGQKLTVKLYAPFEGKKKYTGILAKIELDTQEVCLIDGDHEFIFPFDTIEKANIVAGQQTHN